MFGWFKKNKERSLNEYSNAELSDLMVEFTEAGNKATVILQERQKELMQLYQLIYQEVDHKMYTPAFEHIKQYIDLSEKYGELVRETVFLLLLVVAEDGSGDPEEIFSVYDYIIAYYTEKDNIDLKNLFIQKRMDYDKTVKEVKEMQSRYDFPLDTPTIIALERLENLVVYRYIKLEAVTEYTGFDKVWRAVLNEVDYFEQGDSWNSLNKTTYKGAKNWLKSFSHLCKEDIPEEYKPKEV